MMVPGGSSQQTPTSTPTQSPSTGLGGTKVPIATGEPPPTTTPTQIPSVIPTVVIIPSESPSKIATGTPTQDPPTGSGGTDAPTVDAGPTAMSPNLTDDIAPEFGDTAITGWWTGCTVKEISNNDNNQCTAATNIRLEEPIYLDIEQLTEPKP
jgi:hypothetical protein